MTLVLTSLCAALLAADFMPEQRYAAPQILLHQAKDRYAHLDFDQVLPLVNRVISAQNTPLTTLVEALVLRGCVLAIVQDNSNAETAFRRVLQLMPGYELPQKTPPKIMTVFLKVQADVRVREPIDQPPRSDEAGTPETPLELAVSSAESRPPLPRVAFTLVAGATVVAGAVTGVLGSLLLREQRTYATLASYPGDPSDVMQLMLESSRRGHSLATATNVMLCVSVALAVTSIIAALLTDWKLDSL